MSFRDKGKKLQDTMIDGMSKAIEEGGSLGDILSGAALDFAREMTKTNMKNLFIIIITSLFYLTAIILIL